MNTKIPLALLGGISPDVFMQRYWQKKPLLIRQAIAAFEPLLSRSELFALAQRDGVESRLIQQQGEQWSLQHGPDLKLPPLSRKQWTLLVQGVDLHHDGVHQLLQQFRFVPDARLDDLMISYASDGGGVGPHFDSYDVFLLQAQGCRKWRIGAQKNLVLREGLPLKILDNFEPTQEFVLEPGDMLYLPPRYAHDGVAVGADCMTYSVGFKVPSAGELVRDLLTRLADEVDWDQLYTDKGQSATNSPAAIPTELVDFARKAWDKTVHQPGLLEQLLGESLTEPKANVWFETGKAPRSVKAVRLDRRSRMMVRGTHVFLNGESWRMGGPDAKLLRKLADQRSLTAADFAQVAPSADLVDTFKNWIAQGWMHAG